MEHDKSKLTKSMRWQIADWLAEDRLEEVNKLCNEVNVKDTIYTRYVKRIIDILISLIAIILTLPINLLIGIITFFDVGKPIFFRQERTGRNYKNIYITKFRNMKNTTDENGELLNPELRVTKWGRFVRKTSLDELLNFYSVLKGDMSIIGPRPLPSEYAGRYSNRHAKRLAVRPGLECPPRDCHCELRTWDDQFENDIWYVENCSFIVDCKQIIRLIQFTFSRKSSSVRGAALRESFMGYSVDGKAIGVSDLPDIYIERIGMVCKN